MRLIVGLGNPGPEYFNTRHNFGFLALNCFQDSAVDFSAWQSSSQFKALLSEGQISAEKIILAKPQTFMNCSGQAVKLLIDFYKISPANILVAHDDLDLPLGEIKISQNASAGGHKGVASVIREIGTQNFARLRLGIKVSSPSLLARLFKPSAEKFVLRKFGGTEKELVRGAAQKAGDAILVWLQDGLAAAQNRFN